MASSVYLRPAEEDDKELVLAWRNHPLNYAGYYSQKEPISWDTHTEWWHSRSSEWQMFIIMAGFNKDIHAVGMVNIGWLHSWTPEIGYTIGNPADWGKGYGKEAVKQAMTWLKHYGKQYCHTTILDNNERSIRLVQSLGFVKMCPAREGESWYQVKL